MNAHTQPSELVIDTNALAMHTAALNRVAAQPGVLIIAHVPHNVIDQVQFEFDAIGDDAGELPPTPLIAYMRHRWGLVYRPFDRVYEPIREQNEEEQ